MIQKIIHRAKRFAPAVAAGSLMLAGTSAQATTIDVSEIVTVIQGGVATVTSLGISVLSLVVVVKLFMWVRGVMR